MVDEFDVIEELGRTVHMPPRSSREVVIVSPERIAALEAEVKRLREALTKIASYEEGPVVDSCFDNPQDASIARAALEPQP